MLRSRVAWPAPGRTPTVVDPSADLNLNIVADARLLNFGERAPVFEHGARVLKNFASALFYLATLRADVASTQQPTVASCG
jgi:hypothetical protein